MFLKKSVEMMKMSFEKTRYTFRSIPKKTSEKRFGIYVNVPFCKTKCNFCPFYKEIFTEEIKDRYLHALLQEINEAEISGKPAWIYFGGGTPNMLSVNEIALIIKALKKKVTITHTGIELLPSILTKSYLNELKKIGFTKISIGIETLSNKLLKESNRESQSEADIKQVISHAKSIGLSVNTDMIIGMKNQSAELFLEDIKLLSRYEPDQITTYPYMTIRGLQDHSGINDKEKFEAIEAANSILQKYGYERKSIWCFAKTNDIYDSSSDELTDDYIGFGPAAFSTYKKYKVVNPNVETYINNYNEAEKKFGFVSIKSKSTDNWRRFAKMIYTLSCRFSKDFPFSINVFCFILMLCGVKKGKGLSKKGISFAHGITKTVVESLPFPIQNKSCIKNYDDYTRHLQKIKTAKNSQNEISQAQTNKKQVDVSFSA